MNTCGTCRFFGEVHEFNVWDDAKDDYVEMADYRICGLLAHLNQEPTLPTQPAGVIDGSGYYAALCVREDFGCNQWADRAADREEVTR
jgi:hypothetical protein